MFRTHILLISLTVSLAIGETLAAAPPASYRFNGGRYTGYEVSGKDTTITAVLNPVFVFASPKDRRQYYRLVNNVKKVYPYAMEARQYMQELEDTLAKTKSSREREKFISQMEREIVRKYTPILEKMTFTQGKILIKLIDRETQRSPYQILRQFRGRMTAGFYNAIAKVFKADLNQHYDPSHGEDAQIEEIIKMIEAGQI